MPRSGGPCGNRTRDTRIKSPVLCLAELTARIRPANNSFEQKGRTTPCPAGNREPGLRTLFRLAEHYSITCRAQGKTPPAGHRPRKRRAGSSVAGNRPAWPGSRWGWLGNTSPISRLAPGSKTALSIPSTAT